MTGINVTGLIARLRHTHVNLPRDAEVLAAIERSCEQMWIPRNPDLPWGPDNRGEQDAILVSGETGAGKTATVATSLRAATSKFVDPSGIPTMTVSVKTPSPFSAKELARRILAKLDVEMAYDLTEVELWEAVGANLRGHRVTMVHIDEFQRFTTHKAMGRTEARKVVERLAATLNELLMADDWPVSLLISGTPEIVPFWRTDLFDQVHRRTVFVTFEQINGGYHKALDKALAKYAQLAEIELDIKVDDLAGRIAMAAENTVGRALEFMQEVIVAAVREGSRAVTIEHFAREHARRTSIERDRNVFYVENWTRIGVRQKNTLDQYVDAQKSKAALA